MFINLEHFKELRNRRFALYAQQCRDPRFLAREKFRFRYLTRVNKSQPFTIDWLASRCDDVTRYCIGQIGETLQQAYIPAHLDSFVAEVRYGTDLSRTPVQADPNVSREDAARVIFEEVVKCLASELSRGTNPNETSVTNLAKYYQFTKNWLDVGVIGRDQVPLSAEQRTALEDLLARMRTTMVDMNIFKIDFLPPQPANELHEPPPQPANELHEPPPQPANELHEPPSSIH